MNLTRFLFITSLIFVGSLLSVITLTTLRGEIKHPEHLIQGTWKEVAWRYDKHDKLDANSKEHTIQISDELKENISQGLHIRQSETWIFNKNAQLTLKKKKENPISLRWRMKGRGHILALNYGNRNKEFYQIQKLTQDEMILHFENDTHTRGIVQIIFKKVK